MKDSISDSETERSETPWLPTWDASYAANTGHHRRYDAAFLATHPDPTRRPPARSGLRLRRLHPHRWPTSSPTGEVVGLDPQPALLAEARACAGPNQSFVEGPVQHLDRLLPDDASLRRRGQPGGHAVGAHGRPPRLPGPGPSPAAARRLVPPRDGRRRQHRAAWRRGSSRSRWSHGGTRRAVVVPRRRDLPGAARSRPASPSTPTLPPCPVGRSTNRAATSCAPRPSGARSTATRCWAGCAASATRASRSTMPAGEPRRLPSRGRSPPRRAGPPRRHLRPDLRPPRRPGPQVRLTQLAWLAGLAAIEGAQRPCIARHRG